MQDRRVVSNRPTISGNIELLESGSTLAAALLSPQEAANYSDGEEPDTAADSAASEIRRDAMLEKQREIITSVTREHS